MGNITVKFIGKEYSIPEDVLTYIELLDFTNNVQKQLTNSFVRKLRNELDKGNVACLDDEIMAPDIEQQTGKFIAKLTEHGIFDRTINDYLCENEGYKLISKVNASALAEAKRALNQQMSDWLQGYEDAVQKKDASVTGLGFSIWSGSFVNHAIYAAMEASKVNAQEKAAAKEYQRDMAELDARLESRKSEDEKRYISNTYIPHMEAAITVFAYELLDTYISDLIKNGKMDENTLKYINIDRSNDLLKNLTLSSNKEEILYRAFETCPYNLQVYSRALNYGFLDYESYKTAEYFKQGKNIIFSLVSSLGDVVYPKKFKINYDVAEKMAEFTQSDVATILQAKTKEYVSALTKAYQNAFELITNKKQCYKIIKGLSEKSLFAGEVISKGTAQAQVNSIVTVSIWNQLVNNCGYIDLLEKINAFLPADVEFQSKTEIDDFLIEKLTINFEEARQSIVVKINAEKEAEEKQRIEQERLKAEKERVRQEKRAKLKVNFKKGVKISGIALATIVVLAVVISLISLFKNNVIVPTDMYNDAIALMDSGDWQKAKDIFDSLDDFKDSEELQKQCADKILDSTYTHAIELMEDGKYSDAIDVFEELDGYKESERFVKQCEIALLDADYVQAVQLMNEGKFTEAIKCFEKLNGHKDSSVKIEECQEIIDEDQYNTAIQLANQEKYKDAVKILEKIVDYKDSKKLIDRYSFLGCEKGDIVTLGTYEQDNNLTNGSEAIEWVVLERNGDKALVISKYCIEWLPFNNTATKISWKNSSIRSWLNNTFVNKAFTAQEKKSIISTQHINPDFYDDSESERSWLGTTTDTVFLLSSGETDKYFSSDSARKAEGTEYACNKGKSASWYWWLRSANNIEYAGFVSEGELGFGEEVDRNMGIRPAMWVVISE